MSPGPRAHPLLVAMAGVLLAAPGALAQAAPRRAADPIDTITENFAATLAVTTPSPAPPALLKVARDTVQATSPAERAAAALVLGYGRQREDRVRLLDLARDDPDPRVARHALVALGLLGDSESRLLLAQMLSDRKTEEVRKAFAALALGMGRAGDGSSLNAFALELLPLSRSRHATEIAACFIGFPRDDGRAVLVEYLRLHKTLVSIGTQADAETLLRGIALAGLARRLCTQEEWVLLRQDLGSPREPLRRYLTCWGLFRNGGVDVDEKLAAKIGRELLRMLDDRSPEVAAMAFLAAIHFDKKQTLQRARSLLRGKGRTTLLGPAFLVIGWLGDNGDIPVLQSWSETDLAPKDRAAWSLAAAELARRLQPAQWPYVDSREAEGPPPFPLPRIRAWLASEPVVADLSLAATAVALARLGDAHSVPRMQTLFLRASEPRARRAFALALLRLDAAALDALAEKPGHADQALVGWAQAAQPALWTPLLARLAASDLPGEERARLLRLASLAQAGPHEAIEEWLRRRIDAAPLPEALDDLLGWQNCEPGANMGEPRHR